MNIADEIARRQEQLERLSEAKMRDRKTKETKTGQKIRARSPKPPESNLPRDKDQYNFTDPESRIMKNATNKGFDQHYNVQLVVEHESRLVVGNWLCNAPNDLQAALPTIDTVPPAYCSKKPARGVMITAWR
jgi:hypothetical protein